MGQKVNPHGFRLGVTTDFTSRWFADDVKKGQRYRDYVEVLLERMGRKGVTPEGARRLVRGSTTAIGAIAVRRGDADALICGLDGRFDRHRQMIDQIIGRAEGVRELSTMSLLINAKGAYFLTDTYVSDNPTAEEVAEMTLLAAGQIARFGITPKVALLSSSNFGSRNCESSQKMRAAVDLLWKMAPDLQVDGEMHGDAALSEELRARVVSNSKLEGAANLLVFPSLEAANIALNVLKVMTDALHVGPILLGGAKPAHILTPSVTSRGVVNMSAFAAVEAQAAG